MDIFRVRLNCIDHYQAVPTRYDPQLRNDIHQSQLHKEPRIPVVRVFGSTETGQKVCAHIHGAFPYLYVEYNGSLDSDDVGAYIYRFHLSIDHALAVSYRRNVYDGNNKYVARITLAKGIPFYGFHVGYRYYLKIYMLNPRVMTRLADLLQQGVIMKHKFQPFEAHLQFLLQFMADYNLYGCGFIDAGKVRFRSPVPQHGDGDSSAHLWHSQSVISSCITDDADLPRVSHCSIEVDICVQDIINRGDIKERQLHHDFIERNQPLPSDMKLVASMAGLWKDETKRRKRRMQQSNPGSSPFPKDVLLSMSADPRDSQAPGWIHEQEYRDQIQDLVLQETKTLGHGQPEFEGFVQNDPKGAKVNTLLQSVEDLHPKNLAPALSRTTQSQRDADQDPSSSIVVDEDQIHTINMDGDDVYPDDSDEDAVRDDKPALADQIKPKNAVSKSALPSRTLPQAVRARDPKIMSLDDCNKQSNAKESPRLPIELPSGVGTSRLRAGKRPAIPFCDSLLEIAEEESLISKAPGEHGPSTETRVYIKHSSSPMQHPNPKKRRVEFALDPPKMQSNTPNKIDTLVGAPAQDLTGSSVSGSHKTRSKNESFKKQQSPHTLRFPVVKDPNDPSTKLRLSQQSSSQHSDDGSLKKQVPSVSFASPVDGVDGATSHSVRSNTLDSSGSTIKPEKRQGVTHIGCKPRLHTQFFVPRQPPPKVEEVLATMQSSGQPDAIYQDAFYSKEEDVPQRAREYAGQEFRLEGNTLPYLPDFQPTTSSPMYNGPELGLSNRGDDQQVNLRSRRECTLRSWEIAEPPPAFDEVQHWWDSVSQDDKNGDSSIRIRDPELKPYLSQIDESTPRNKHGFKYSQKKKSASVQNEAQYMSTLSLEIHVNTRGKLVANPEEDEVQCIFWCSKSDDESVTGVQRGIIILSEDESLARRVRKMTTVDVVEETSELELMTRMVGVVRNFDPDILTGYEVHGSSWGYLIERARYKYDYNLCDEFSRMKSQSFGRFGKEEDRWGFNTTSTIRVTGRHMVNIWRAMRGELNLLQYTMENVVWHLLRRRIPHYSHETLTSWYTNGRHRDLSKWLRYFLTRTRLDIDILETNELIPRTSEQARLLGVDFFSVFSRGSQFKVESIMFRIAKPENFMLVSPNRKQVGSQNALECLPLVMEPQSAFYNSPLLVLDFQSLYPSVMIAYNYCYSTFLGRIANWRGTSKMGFTDYQRQEGLLSLLKDYINIAPNGIMYCKQEIRKSLLAKMLTEILETRVMVKSGMKQDKDDKALQQLLNNRQLALKLLANVTYGYTSASFSGRMPCSEIADSIVQTGRETLERAIALIHSVEKWKAEVVYGDTDSLFVYLPGRTKDQAFDIGQEITQAVTDMNPRPIKLKFEKVYHPCVLLAKKRYVGYKYESKGQTKPEFDAKGIETVRRDGTPAEQKIEEKALKILFETADLSQVKSYFQRQCEKIMRGAVSIQDFCFAREVKLGTYSDRGLPPPGAMISTKRMLEDARAEPQYGERVPYVVVSGAPGARLIDRCVSPEDLLSNSHLQLDAEYYISKNLIPPLERIFNLVGANIRQWYDEMPKVQRIHRVDYGGAGGAIAKRTLESYMKAAACLVCHTKTKNENSICDRCLANTASSLVRLQTQLRAEEKKFLEVEKICQSCAGLAPLDKVSCDSKDCPVFYTRMKQAARYRTEKSVVDPATKELLEGEIIAREALEW